MNHNYSRAILLPQTGTSRVLMLIGAIALILSTITTQAQVLSTSPMASYTSIQAAIDGSTDGAVITVPAGTYTEDLTVPKALTINGPNVGTPGSATRLPEAVLSDGSITVNGTGAVLIDGFHVYQTNATPSVINLAGETPVTIQNTKLERVGAVAGQSVRAIVTSAGSGAKLITDNLFTGSTSGGLFSGHKTWQSGIYVNAAASTVSITNNTFENLRAALNLDDFNSGISLSGNTFNTNGTHLSFGGSVPTSGSFVLGANDFKAPADGFVNLSNVATDFRLAITSSTFNGAAFSTYSLADLFLIESTMYHRGRSGRKGLVTYVAGNEYVVNTLTTIQSAIDYGTAGDVIHVSQGTYTENLTVDKNLTVEGANKGICGKATRATESLLNAPATESGVITFSGSVTATFDGFKIKGVGVAYLTQPNQDLTFRNSVFELNFLPAANNLYAASSALTLDCNAFKAIAGTNDGSSSHIFVGDGTLTATNNTFTSETAISSLTGTTTSLPVWLNITGNTGTFSVLSNIFTNIDIGILLAGNAGNGLVKNNEFSDAKRNAYNMGSGNGTGIALFGNYTPSAAVLIQNNKFYDSETGVRTSSGDATNNFPTTNLLAINNNSFVNISNGSFRIGNSFNSSTSALNATCNWYENAAVITGNSTNITTTPQLSSGVDDETATVGFQQAMPNCVYTDLTANIYVRSSVLITQPVSGTAAFTVVMTVAEVNSVPTSGTITISINKDPSFQLNFDNMAVMFNGNPIQNTAWTFDDTSDGSRYILTTNQVITGGNVLSVGLTGVLSAGATKGSLTITGVVKGGSGGEINGSNNSTANKVDYFPL